jgi:signal transduction histidine kinase
VQQGLASKLDVQSIYDLVGDTFRDFFNAQVVMISTYDPQSNFIQHRYAIECGQRVYSAGTHPPGGFRSQIIQTRQPFLLNTNVAAEAARLGQPTLPGTITPKSWLGVPMLVGDQVAGILSVQNLDEENAFSESDVRLLQTFAASMGIALENARLYEQARHLAILEERQRLGRELHDSVTQSLYGINLYAEAAAGQLDIGQSETARGHLGDIQKTAQESLAEMRLLIYELRPPILEREGLLPALQNRLYSVENRAGLKFSLHSNLDERLPVGVEDGLFRIAHEALNNILKHAQAKNIQVRILKEEGVLTMEISDDGIGFDPANACQDGCLGLVSMRERSLAQGWRFVVNSSPGAGTCVRVEVKG